MESGGPGGVVPKDSVVLGDSGGVNTIAVTHVNLAIQGVEWRPLNVVL